MATNTFTSLVEDLLIKARELDAHAASTGQTLDSTNDPFLLNLPDSIQAARNDLVNGSMQLRRAAEGPAAALLNLSLSWADNLAISTIYLYKIPQTVPFHGSITYTDLASSTGIPPGALRRLLRQAMTNTLFHEPSPGHVAHTPTSRLLATNPGLMDLIGWCTQELVPASASYVDALKRYGDTSEPTQTAFGLANGSNLPVYLELSKTPERARRFGSAMKGIMETDTWNARHTLGNFDWAAVDRPGAVVYDVGGGMGHVSFYLAGRTDHLTFMVQDLPHVAEQASKVPLPAGLEGRVRFVAQNFMQPQAGPPADVVLLRAVLHNWSDMYAKQIIKNLIPALKNGTRVLVVEVVLDEEPVTDWTRKIGPDVDLVMALITNGRLRTSEEYKALFKAVDERFVWKASRRTSPTSTMTVEMVFEEEAK